MNRNVINSNDVTRAKHWTFVVNVLAVTRPNLWIFWIIEGFCMEIFDTNCVKYLHLIRIYLAIKRNVSLKFSAFRFIFAIMLKLFINEVFPFRLRKAMKLSEIKPGEDIASKNILSSKIWISMLDQEKWCTF